MGDTMAEKKTAQKADTKEASLYEVAFLVSPFVGEDATAKEVEDVHAIIEGEGGEIGSEGSLSLIKLAYSIDHKVGNKKTTHESAYFGWVQFRATPQAADTIGKRIGAKETIIRSLLMHTQEGVSRPTQQQLPEEEGGSPQGGAVSDAQLDEAIKELVS